MTLVCQIMMNSFHSCMTKSKPHFTDTPLLPRVFFVPGEGLYIFSKFNLLNTETINPLSPNIHIQILQNWSPNISFMNELREFDKRSRHFPLGDHFTNSHNLISWHCVISLGEIWR